MRKASPRRLPAGPATARVVALPLSAVPELRQVLAPFLGEGDRRDNVVMVRLGDEPLAHLDTLVEAGLFGSRSEAAAFLIGAGIRGQRALLERIAGHSAEIRKMRRELRDTALAALRESSAASRPARRRPSIRKR